MKTEKTSINQTIKLFSISRTTLYTYLKKLKISPQKSGRIAYLTEQNIIDIKGFISKNKPSNTHQYEQVEQVEQIREKSTAEKIHIEKIKILEKNLIDEQIKNRQEREENRKLVLQLGQWQGRAKTLEEQNHKLLTLQVSESKNPEKIGFFQKIFGKKY